jgi:hypothetical protein
MKKHLEDLAYTFAHAIAIGAGFLLGLAVMGWIL